MKITSKTAKVLSAVLCVLIILFPSVTVFAQTVSQDDASSIYNDSVWYKNTGGVSSANCSGTSLIGSDNEQKIWNYFKSKGLADAPVAGIMGNIEQESGFDPQRIQGGGDSQNPADAGSGGWGLVQWTPGVKVLELAKSNKITGPIYELSTQLDLIWAEMNGTSPNGTQDMVKGLENINDPAQAATYFNQYFEGGTDPTAPNGKEGIREYYAQQILQQYGGAGGGTGGGGCTIGSSTDCTTVTGDPKILCEAEKYQGIYYRWGGGHQGYAAFIAGCPDPSNPPDNQPTGSPPDQTDGGLSGNPSPCATDCTGLVSIAVDAAFNLDYMWTINGSMQGEGAQYWKPIPVARATAGDIVTTQDHVEIVDHVSGNTVYIFGSHSTGTQTGPTTAAIDYWTTGAWHWTGPGSTK